jgi:hypothetical protein
MEDLPLQLHHKIEINNLKKKKPLTPNTLTKFPIGFRRTE